MSKNLLRKDKTCLNCRHVVENRFCPNCGQENIDTRKTFYQLFIHFFEDLTHYENAFWKTIKNLLLKPAILTKEYLSGKRLSYLAPFRLYIFISFITFFLITIFPNKASNITTIKEADTVNQTEKKEVKDFLFFGYDSTKELDSIQKHGAKSDKLSSLQYWAIRKGLAVSENNTPTEIFKKFKESFINNFSKFLFIYMPIFAFFLWLFHSKKRWYYFDHGIFTLHYFSFLLLLFLILFLIDKVFLFFGSSGISDFINGLINFAGYTWMAYYFLPAHHRFYGETRIVSFIKSSFLFFINFFFIIIILLLFAFYTFINLH
ncbi:DUF3667 domain-containing protein [Flavobacterium sp.]|uniref:DUF3667 domain-containing protein n=1 Tax=Flavobacterium sp. TaxID=239 RepID=UPI002B4B742F|nr:DUF3667 domain-containing protein [Flavobacterium sp.]HLF53397.1 DUF3667 domain-containing protein [Flavobacterium sp.]